MCVRKSRTMQFARIAVRGVSVTSLVSPSDVLIVCLIAMSFSLYLVNLIRKSQLYRLVCRHVPFLLLIQLG